MAPLRRRFLAKVFKVFDVLALIAAFGVAAFAAAGFRLSALPRLAAVRLPASQIFILLLVILGWQGIFSAFGLYRSRRIENRLLELRDVLSATLVATMLLVLVGGLLSDNLRTWRFAASFWAAGALIIATSRLTMRAVLDRVRLAGRNLRHLVIVGTNRRALALARHIQREPELGYRLVGFVDDEWNRPEPLAHGDRIIAPLLGFSRLVRQAVVDEVIVCLPVKSFYDDVSQMAALCQEQGLVVRVLSDLFDPGRQPDEDAGPLRSVRTVHSGALQEVPAVLKRIFDIGISALLLVSALPLCALIALAIKWDSPGPVLFRQQRRGLNKRSFTMLKFRTMTFDAEDRLAEVAHLNKAGGPTFKIRRDPRITRIGRLLRKTSLDELPQLVNVLRGDMSLVGPRPLFGWEYGRIEEPWITRRFSVRPGLTGLWQVSGRSDLPFEKRIELDLHYVDHWSLGLDMRILARTIPAVLTGRGAI